MSSEKIGASDLLSGDIHAKVSRGGLIVIEDRSDRQIVVATQDEARDLMVWLSEVLQK